MTTQAASATATLEYQNGQVCVKIGGNWSLEDEGPDVRSFLSDLEGKGSINALVFEDSGIGSWDSALAVFVRTLTRFAEEKSMSVDYGELPDGLKRLLSLASSAGTLDPPKEETLSWLEKVGLRAVEAWRGFEGWLEFLGGVTMAFLAMLRGRAVFRKRDTLVLLESCGAQALPIVALISFLVGMILAFVGAIQLAPFGGDIYVANLVGVAMVREMGAMMCAMVMAGRTGAAYAAQIGSMKVTEEVDALKTMGISPMEFLVLPRMLMLTLMMPLLCVFADFIGILGGMMVSLMMLDVTVVQYVLQTDYAIDPVSFLLGVIKAGFFGLIIACSGCIRGLQCGNSSSAVGDASTSAVVTSITLVIIADAIFAVIFNILGL